MRMSDWSSDVCSSDLFALAAADGDEGVQSLETGLDGFVHRGARDDARRLHFDAHALLGLDRTLAVDRIAEAIDDAAEQAPVDGDVDERGGAVEGVLLLDLGVRADDEDVDKNGQDNVRTQVHNE